MDSIGESSYDKYAYITWRAIMAMKQTGRKVYRSMQGKQVDMDLLRKKNELTPAVGNARVNARGDELGPGGQIIRKNEDVISDYYRENPVNVPDEEPTRRVQTQQVETVADEEPVRKSSRKKTQEEWIEDEDGNFVKKGE